MPIKINSLSMKFFSFLLKKLNWNKYFDNNYELRYPTDRIKYLDPVIKMIRVKEPYG
jgi:hypothetical protein